MSKELVPADKFDLAAIKRATNIGCPRLPPEVLAQAPDIAARAQPPSR